MSGKRGELKTGLGEILKRLSTDKDAERKRGQKLLDQAVRQFGPDAVMVLLRDLYPTAAEPVRSGIVMALRHMQHPRSVEFVIDTVNDRRLSRQLRIVAAETAVAIAVPEAFDAVFDALRGPEDFIKGPLVRALARADARARELAVKMLFEKPEPMQDQIVEKAAGADLDALVQWLTAAYKDMDEYRPDLARALESVGVFTMLLRAIAELDWRRIRQLGGLIQPGDAVGRKYLARAIERENPQIRWNALEAFTLLSHGEAIAETVETSIRWGVEEGLKKIAALDQLSDLSITPRLQRFLGSPDTEERREFSEALGALLKLDAQGLFDTFLNDPDSRVRARAAQIMHRLEPTAAVQSLVEMLERREPAMKRAAVQAMGVLGLIDFAKPLASYLNSDDLILRDLASGALKRIQKAQSKSAKPGSTDRKKADPAAE